MATFTRGHWTRQTHTFNEPLRRSLERPIATTPGAIQFTYSAADWITLRGIPAIGPNVGGAIPGTRPDST
jgi:hypothetical protein